MADPVVAVSRNTSHQHHRTGTSNEEQQQILEEELSHLPQWKRDFLIKKRALMLHQQEHRVKKSEHNEAVTSNGRYDCVTDKENNRRKPTTVSSSTTTNSSTTTTSTTITMSDTDIDKRYYTEDKLSENESEDSDSSSDNHRSGGYSFITGEQIAAVETESDDSSQSDGQEQKFSGSDSNKADASSADLSYKPGYVSKLLNKWTSISYNKPEPTTKPVLQTRVSQTEPIASQPKHKPPLTSHSSMTSSEKVMNGGPRPVETVRMMMEKPVRSARRASYRDPVEIVLIENGGDAKEDERKENSSEASLTPVTSTSTITTEIPWTDDNNAADAPGQPVAGSEWDPDLSIHEKVQLARAMFESSRRPPIPPRRKRQTRSFSLPPLPPPAHPPPQPPAAEESPEILAQTNSPRTSPRDVKNEAPAAASLSSSAEPSPSPTVTETTTKAAELPNRRKTSPSHGKREAPQPPLFTSVRLKPTQHKLYDSGDSTNTSPVHRAKPTKENGQTSPVQHAKPAKEDTTGPLYQPKPTKDGSKASPGHQFKPTRDDRRVSPVHNAAPSKVEKKTVSPVYNAKLSPATSKTAETSSPGHQSKLLTQSQTAYTSNEKQQPQPAEEAEDVLVVELAAPIPDNSSNLSQSNNVTKVSNQNGDVKHISNGPTKSFTGKLASSKPAHRDITTKPSTTENTASRTSVSSLSDISDKPVRNSTSQRSESKLFSAPKQNLISAVPAKTTASSIPDHSTTQKSNRSSPVISNSSTVTNGVKPEGWSIERKTSKPEEPKTVVGTGSKLLMTNSQAKSPERRPVAETNSNYPSRIKVKDIPFPKRDDSKISMFLKDEIKTGEVDVASGRLASLKKTESSPHPAEPSEAKAAKTTATSNTTPTGPASTAITASQSSSKSPASLKTSVPAVATIQSSPKSPPSPNKSSPAPTRSTAQPSPKTSTPISTTTTKTQPSPTASSSAAATTAHRDTTQPSPKLPPSPNKSSPATVPKNTAQSNAQTIVSSKAPNSTRSLNDIPSPSVSRPAAKKSADSSGGNDLMAVLKKRRGNDVPVTNIDDILSSRRSSGSSTVFDTRKSMGSKRKVPEYEKIHVGPVVDYTGTQVVVAGGCLKPPSNDKPIRKNLSFNELDMASVHEYPSEKIMIQHQPREEGAVYWDDPDHLQAVPGRSQDEPEEPEAGTSFKSATGGRAAGFAGSHRSSLTEDYQFGQGVGSSSSYGLSGSTDQKADNSEDYPEVKPTSESDAMSFSSASADLLF